MALQQDWGWGARALHPVDKRNNRETAAPALASLRKPAGDGEAPARVACGKPAQQLQRWKPYHRQARRTLT
eukprot:11184659-Lingulodinium_polyedra.AAC.1